MLSEFAGMKGGTFQKLNTFCQYLYLLDFFQFLLEVGQGKNSATPPKPAFSACIYEGRASETREQWDLKAKEPEDTGREGLTPAG